MTTSDSVADLAWYADSGATNHVTANLENLMLKSDYNGSDKLMGNGKCLPITHTGSTHLNSTNATLKLLNVLRVPRIKKSLVNISKLASENDVYVEFHSKFCLMKDKHTGRVLLQWRLENGLYLLSEGKRKIDSNTTVFNIQRSVSSDT